jgi:hypothetical protein
MSQLTCHDEPVELRTSRANTERREYPRDLWIKMKAADTKAWRGK